MNSHCVSTCPDCVREESLRRASMRTWDISLWEMGGKPPYKKGAPLLCKYLLYAYTQGVSIKAIDLFFDPRDNFIYLVDPDLPVVLSDSQ